MYDGVRDAWKSVEGTSKEEARTKYVEKLLEVRLVFYFRRVLPSYL